jgi:hypothetical protein
VSPLLLPNIIGVVALLVVLVLLGASVPVIAGLVGFSIILTVLDVMRFRRRD